MSDEQTDGVNTYLTLDIHWHWVVTFALHIGPLINIKTGALGDIGEREAVTYVSIPAHGSPYQDNQCTIRAYTRPKGDLYVGKPIDDSYMIIADNNNTKTTIIIPKNNQYWDGLKKAVTNFAKTHQMVERMAVGTQFTTILEHYYELKNQGQKVKLADLARQYKVNYDSLRQAKIRFDRRLKASGSEFVETEPPDIEMGLG